MNRLRELRHKSGFTLREVAVRMGLHFTSVCRHECGNPQPRGDAIAQYAKLYGVRPVEIYIKPR